MAHRYFTTSIEDVGGSAYITGADAMHLAKVLRAKPGQQLTLCDGAGSDYEACIEEATVQQVRLLVLAKTPSKAEPGLWTEVFLACAKGDKLDWAIQKCVELGASGIHLFYSENCVAKPKNEEEKNKRYSRIALEAAKQSGRGMVPKVGLPQPFAAALRQGAACSGRVLLHEKAETPLQAVLAGLPPGKQSLALFSGPEGGFSPGETQLARENGWALVGLGPRILRCETAPVAALAAAMALSGNLG